MVSPFQAEFCRMFFTTMKWKYMTKVKSDQKSEGENVVILTMCVWHCKMPSPEMLLIMKLVRPGMNNIQVYSLLTEGLGLPYDSGQFVCQWRLFLHECCNSLICEQGMVQFILFKKNGMITGISSWSWWGAQSSYSSCFNVSRQKITVKLWFRQQI